MTMKVGSGETARPLAERVPSPQELKRQASPVHIEEEENVESLNERGDRVLKEAGASLRETVSNMYSRLSTMGNRLWDAFKTGVGGAAVGAEIGKRTLGAQADYVRNMPTMAENMAIDAKEGVVDFANTFRPRRELTPSEIERVATLETILTKLQDDINALPQGEERDHLVNEYQMTERIRNHIRDTEREIIGTQTVRDARAAVARGGRALGRGAAAVGGGIAMGAVLGVAAVAEGGAAIGRGVSAASRGIAEGTSRLTEGVVEGAYTAAALGIMGGEAAVGAVKGKVGEMTGAVKEHFAEREREFEEACVARAELFLMDVAKTTKQEMPTLNREALIALGKGLQASFARRLAQGAWEVGKDVVMAEQWADMGKGYIAMGNAAIDGIKGLYDGTVDAATFLQDPSNRAWIASELQRFNIEGGQAVTDALRNAKNVTGRTIAQGARATGRGLKTGAKAVEGVAVAGGAVVAMGGIAIAERATRAPREAAIKKWNEHAPAIAKGIASGVDSLNDFAENAVNVPRDLAVEVDKVATEINKGVEQTLSFFDRLKQLLDAAKRVGTRLLSQYKLEIAQEMKAAKDPKKLEEIRQAMDAQEQIEHIATETRPATENARMSGAVKITQRVRPSAS